MRRLLSLLVIGSLLAVIGFVLDGVARGVAQNRVSALVAADSGLTPEVSIGGGLFLPQVARGRYADVAVTLRQVALDRKQNGLVASTLVAQVRGVQVPFGELTSGTLTSVAADSAFAQVTVGYAELNRFAPKGVRLSPGGRGRVAVTGSLTVLGQPLELTALADLTVDGDRIVLTAQEIRTPDGLLSAALSAAVGGRLDSRIAVPPLPLGAVLRGATATADGIVLSAEAGALVLTPQTFATLGS